MKKLTLSIGAGIIALAGIIFYYPFVVGANPTFHAATTCYIDGLSSSTSTVKWMRSGVSTSTIGHTTLCNITNPNNTIPTALYLTLQHTASSSPLSVVTIDVETSLGDGTQWSRESFSTFESVTATTSVAVYNPNFTRKWQQVASTTEPLSGAVTATTTTTILIPNHSRAKYMKIYFSVPVGSQPSNIWASLNAVKEQ